MVSLSKRQLAAIHLKSRGEYAYAEALQKLQYKYPPGMVGPSGKRASQAPSLGIVDIIKEAGVPSKSSSPRRAENPIMVYGPVGDFYKMRGKKWRGISLSSGSPFARFRGEDAQIASDLRSRGWNPNLQPAPVERLLALPTRSQTLKAVRGRLTGLKETKRLGTAFKGFIVASDEPYSTYGIEDSMKERERMKYYLSPEYAMQIELSKAAGHDIATMLKNVQDAQSYRTPRKEWAQLLRPNEVPYVKVVDDKDTKK